MLKNNLLEIPQIVLMRSDKIFHKLVNLLIFDSKDLDNNIDELREGVRDFYPNSYRLDEISLSLSQKNIVNSGITTDYNFSNYLGIDYNFNFLEDLFDKYLEVNGVNIHVKQKYLEEYLGLITKISPIQLISYKLSVLLMREEIDFHAVESFSLNYSHLGLYIDKQNEYAENHLHLKGAHYLSYNFIELFRTKTNKEYFKKKFLKEIPRINEFSFINNNIYSIGQIIETLKLSVNFIYGYILGKEKLNIYDFKESLHKIILLNKTIKNKYDYSIENLSQMKMLFNYLNNTLEHKFIKLILKNYNNEMYPQCYLLENILFSYIYNNENSNELKFIIKIYFHSINILRSYMVMSQNIGLSHFSEFSSSNIRNIERRNAKSIASSIINSGTNYLNAKMDVKNKSNVIKNIVEDFIYSFNSVDNNFKYNFSLSTKKNHEKDIVIQTGELLPHFFYKRKELKKEALSLENFLQNVKYKNLDLFSHKLKYAQIEALINKEKLKNKKFDISSYIVSIDAVGKETSTPPEVFAPFFNYLRKQPKKLKNNIYGELKKFNYHPKLILTVHAGEDFNHIITGMRRVHESIKFFDMQNNDRLGHVLSLGIDPKDWIESIQNIVVLKGDLFDDLVWLVMQLKKFSHYNLHINRLINVYEDKVWKYFREIYATYNKSISISDLYEAWSYRSNCPITYYKKQANATLFDEYSTIVLKEMNNKKSREIYELYLRDKIVREKSNEVVNICKSKINEDELNVWRALQDFMINKISKKGIIIETNPSSNIFISYLDEYKKHPIFRFYPPKKDLLKSGALYNNYGLRDGIVSVTINSDDPAVFVTSLQNEYRTIKNIAIEKYNCSDKEAEDWIDDIRKFGVKVFKESYIESD